MTSFLAPCTQVSTSQVVDVSVTQNVQSGRSCAGPAAGEMSLESSMTDDDSRSHVNVQRPRHYRRHRGADDVFPTHLLHRYQVH